MELCCTPAWRLKVEVNPFQMKAWFLEALSERNNGTFSVKAAKMSTDIRFISNYGAPQLQLTNKRCVRDGERDGPLQHQCVSVGF